MLNLFIYFEKKGELKFDVVFLCNCFNNVIKDEELLLEC